MNFGCSFFGCRYPEHLKQELLYLKSVKFNTILFTFSENDYFFYFDTIKEMVGIAKSLDFTVYINPWGVLGIFGGEAFSKWLLDNTDIWQTDNNNNKVPHACINHPKTLDLLNLWLKKSLMTDADYLFWDEPHFYFKDFQNKTGIWGCTCEICRDKFSSIYKYPFPTEINSDLSEFRSRSICSFLKKLCITVKESNKKNNICLLPTEDTLMGGLSVWEEIIPLKNYIDILSTDPYWQRKNENVDEYVGYYSKKLKKLAEKINCKSELWIQAYKIIGNRENEIVNAVNFSKINNFNSTMFWSYKGGYPMSALQSDDFKKTWKTIIQTI
jgi:hypothetical protein